MRKRLFYMLASESYSEASTIVSDHRLPLCPMEDDIGEVDPQWASEAG